MAHCLGVLFFNLCVPHWVQTLCSKREKLRKQLHWLIASFSPLMTDFHFVRLVFCAGHQQLHFSHFETSCEPWGQFPRCISSGLNCEPYGGFVDNIYYYSRPWIWLIYIHWSLIFPTLTLPVEISVECYCWCWIWCLYFIECDRKCWLSSDVCIECDLKCWLW